MTQFLRMKARAVYRALRRLLDPTTLLLAIALSLLVTLAVVAFTNGAAPWRPLLFTGVGFSGGVVAVVVRRPRHGSSCRPPRELVEQLTAPGLRGPCSRVSVATGIRDAN